MPSAEAIKDFGWVINYFFHGRWIRSHKKLEGPGLVIKDFDYKGEWLKAIIREIYRIGQNFS